MRLGKVAQEEKGLGFECTCFEPKTHNHHHHHGNPGQVVRDNALVSLFL